MKTTEPLEEIILTFKDPKDRRLGIKAILENEGFLANIQQRKPSKPSSYLLRYR
ncbi:MAG: hypothetical protein ACI9BD_000896 [Candidatus Marinamargulisbacteria bacterium]|jgi:hypothetical protein